MINSRALKLYLVILLFGSVLFTFLPSIGYDFIDWDDFAFVKYNQPIQAVNAKSLYWMLTTSYANVWHPVTWLSHAIDIYFFGLNPSPHRLVNILLHCSNVVIFALLGIALVNLWNEKNQAEKSVGENAIIVGAIGAALLFGVHPLRVESVVWISERKDVLCAFFYLLALLFYLRYVRFAHAPSYYCAVASTALAVLSKPMAVTIPLVMLLFDYYPLQRISYGNAAKLLREKWPFFLMAIITISMNYIANLGHTVPLSYVPWHMRIMNAFFAIVYYIRNSAIPGTLLPIHQMDRSLNYFSFPFVASMLICMLISVAAIYKAFKGQRLWLAVWLYFLITIAPASGLFMSYRHAMADRYTYLPTMSFWLLMGLGLMWIWDYATKVTMKTFIRVTAVFCVATLALFYGSKTQSQMAIWNNSETFWSYVLNASDFVPDNAYFAMGTIWEIKGDVNRAIEYYKIAHDLNPKNEQYIVRLATSYITLGNQESANSAIDKLLALNERKSITYYKVARQLFKHRLTLQSIDYLKKALIEEPNLGPALSLLVGAYVKTGDYEAARNTYAEAKSSGYKIPESIDQIISAVNEELANRSHSSPDE
jgi:protein O-mannosyl-transferase